MQTFTETFVGYLKCRQNSQSNILYTYLPTYIPVCLSVYDIDIEINEKIYISIFILQKFKYLQGLTLAILLNKQLQPPTLISISNVPSVSYCSTVMLYLTFFLSCILLSVLPSRSRKGL